MAMEPGPRYLERLRIGGGLGDPADGGADFDANGDIATDGHIAAGGDVAVGADEDADHRVSVTAGAARSAFLDLNQADVENGGAVWFDGADDALRIGTRDGSAEPVAAVEIEKGSADVAVQGELAAKALEVIDHDDLGASIVVNGDMELDSNWANRGTPTTNERSNEQSHAGTYSRKIAGPPTFAGAEQSIGVLHAGSTYRLTYWVYRVSGNLRARAVGTTTFWLAGNSDLSPQANSWVQMVLEFTVPATENARIEFIVGTTSGTFYIDDVSLQQVGGGAIVHGLLKSQQGLVTAGTLQVESGDVSAGIATLKRGVLTLPHGGGGVAPGAIKLHSPNGTAWHLFVEDDGTLKVHSALPTQNVDGNVVGNQT